MKLLNRSEEITFDILSGAVSDVDARVFPKVRVADTVPLNNSGISNELFTYGLQAHFDFVVTDGEYEPLFAVEYDGPLHLTSKIQRERDQKKNAICKHFDFSILRINSRYINRKYQGIDLLSYFVDVWFLADAFHEAQRNGGIPYDEIFDPCFIMSSGNSNKRWPYWLSREAQVEIQNMHKTGVVHNYIPSHWTGLDENEAYRSLAWLEVKPKTFLFTQTGMQHQMFPAYFSDVLFQISVLDLRKRLDEFLRDPSIAVGWDEIQPVYENYKSNFKMMECGGGGYADVPGPNAT